MPAQRKIFRIEETMRAELQRRGPLAPDAADTPPDVIAELRAMRALMEQQGAAAGTRTPTDRPSQEMRKLKIELDVIGDAIKQTRCEIVSLQDQGFDSDRVARVTKELEAVFSDTTVATERILTAAEDIDHDARALAGLLKGGHEQGPAQGLAQDIQERVTAIFEACNFHDLTGQRIAKVADMLKLVEEHLARMMEIWSVIERFNVAAAQSSSDLDAPLNGPKLNGDQGHSTQDEIDRLFR